MLSVFLVTKTCAFQILGVFGLWFIFQSNWYFLPNRRKRRAMPFRSVSFRMAIKNETLYSKRGNLLHMIIGRGQSGININRKHAINYSRISNKSFLNLIDFFNFLAMLEMCFYRFFASFLFGVYWMRSSSKCGWFNAPSIDWFTHHIILNMNRFMSHLHNSDLKCRTYLLCDAIYARKIWDLRWTLV